MGTRILFHYDGLLPRTNYSAFLSSGPGIIRSFVRCGRTENRNLHFQFVRNRKAERVREREGGEGERRPGGML